MKAMGGLIIVFTSSHMEASRVASSVCFLSIGILVFCASQLGLFGIVVVACFAVFRGKVALLYWYRVPIQLMGPWLHLCLSGSPILRWYYLLFRICRN